MSLEFRHIAHSYGQNRALEDVSFTAPKGEITCLLGSSGCGKSTLLNLAAGLLPVQHGSIHLDGELLAGNGSFPPPEKRPIGLVFQDGALFPHMNIADNVGFGLQKNGDWAGLVDGWLNTVGLAGLGKRFPHQLSGGQQQRAALARAMATQPHVLLMDEPFASVDIVLRRSLRRECRTLLRERGATTILVTHDPDEALDVADNIAVMEAGQIVQFGSPQELHQNPVSASVGAIFHGAQVVAGKHLDGGIETAFGMWPKDSIAGDFPADLPDGCDFDLLVHASEFEVEADTGTLIVRDFRPNGSGAAMVVAGDNGAELTIACDPAFKIAAGSRVQAMPKIASIRAFKA
ncbi:MAG: ABC transporter ATP-binding protein [Erythrobacter sp.]